MNSTLKQKVAELKKKYNAVILAHNYTTADVQELADITGDSLALARKASKVTADIILFAGVKFMAETACILNPTRTVLMPDKDAGCPMADMVSAHDVIKLKEQNPAAVVICYVNSSIEVKAESDICCTSSNAEKIVRSIPAERPVIFVPDKYLGGYVADKLGREVICVDGYCPIHQKITPQRIAAARKKYPQAKLIVHPECNREVAAQAELIFSTGQMLSYIKHEAPPGDYLIGTENGMLYPMRSAAGKGVILYEITDDIICRNMKKNTPEKIVHSLETMQFQVTVEKSIMNRASTCLKKMLELS